MKITTERVTSPRKLPHVEHKFEYIAYKDTGYFSKLVVDYLDGADTLQPFFNFTPDKNGLAKAIEVRAQFPVNRTVLVDTLKAQYAGTETPESVAKNIDLLVQENTFTVCTAHQPNLFTGYLYFVYKILHAIKLSRELAEAHPDKNFVPVYYMGSEDNDLDELGVFQFRGEKFVWDGDGQKGAVGRMSTKSLKKLLAEVFKLVGPPGPDCDKLIGLLTKAYTGHATIGRATHYLVNELFGQYGLIVLDPDDAALKALFIPVMEDELLNQSSSPVLARQIAELANHYKIQAHPREINLFYLADQLRERIERKEDKWVVVKTTIEWTRGQLLQELHEHPERFSPNVMLRGLFQETILPNVAFIGGGAEVAYWMQLNSLFQYYNVFFPCVLLRQSVMVTNPTAQKLREQLELSLADLFTDEQDLCTLYIERHSDGSWRTLQEQAQLVDLLGRIRVKAISVDATLGPAAEAALTKMTYQLGIIEKKMLRAEKKKVEVSMARIAKLKKALFPDNNLQERVENFMEPYLMLGDAFFDELLEGIRATEPEFLVFYSIGSHKVGMS